MRKTMLFVWMMGILGLPLMGWAQAPYTEFKAGYWNPAGVKAGYLFGVHLGRMIDESLSWGVELNYFQRTYRKEDVVAKNVTQGGTQYETRIMTAEYTTRVLPVMAKLNYEHPIALHSPFFWRASVGLGWEFLWNNERNLELNMKDNRFFNGFGWQVAAGIGISISSSGNFFVDLFYNRSAVKSNRRIVEGLPTWDELNLNGLGVKVGVSIVGFGW